MTFEEAFKLLKEGKKIRYSEWYASAFWELTEEGIYITTPQGSSPVIAVFPYDFLKDNWEIYEKKKSNKEILINMVYSSLAEDRKETRANKYEEIKVNALLDFIDTLEIK